VLYPKAVPTGLSANLRAYLECDDVHATVATTRARGATFSHEPNEMQWGPFAAFLDREGCNHTACATASPRPSRSVHSLRWERVVVRELGRFCTSTPRDQHRQWRNPWNHHGQLCDSHGQEGARRNATGGVARGGAIQEVCGSSTKKPSDLLHGLKSLAREHRL
jgi:hypothetical protein